MKVKLLECVDNAELKTSLEEFLNDGWSIASNVYHAAGELEICIILTKPL